MNNKNKITNIGKVQAPNRVHLARGLTLIELMVASSIIVILILSVGTVLSGLGQLVGVSQTAIRVNAKASSIGTVVCQDVRRAGQNGFICIAQAADGTPQLFILNPVSTPSVTGGGTGTGGLSCLGQCDNTGFGSILWHTTWVFNLAGSGTDSNVSDSIFTGPSIALSNGVTGQITDLGRYHALNRLDCCNVVSAFQSAKSTVSTSLYSLPATLWPVPAAPPLAPITLPPSTLNDMTNMWKILSLYASSLNIEWTDGTTIPDTANPGIPILCWYGWIPAYDSSAALYAAGAKVLYPAGNGGKVYQCITANGTSITNGVQVPIVQPNPPIPPLTDKYWSLQSGYIGPKDPNWGSNLANSGKPEFNMGTAAAPIYRALFCHDDNPSSWPTALKIRFTIIDPDAPKASSFGNGLDYEIICPLSD